MSDKKTVLLLDFLLEGASGEEREALSAAYQRAFSETEEYRALRQLLNDTLFTGPRGSELFSVGAGALEKGMTHTGEFDTVSASMRYVLENSRQLLAETNACIHTLRMDPRRLQLIDKRDASALRAFLTALVNELCYFVTALYGPGLLAGFRFDPGQGAADMLAAVNGGITNVLNRLADAPAPRAWRITRQQFGGANLVRFNGVCLHYDITQRQMEAELTRQTPFLYTPRENGDLLCAGVGLLTNLKPENGAAVLGAPLMHDYCVISLSDLMTPWETIEQRLVAAAQADFVICLCNPASHKRADYLQRACDILLAHRAGKTVCATVRNIGREGQETCITTLAQLRDAPCDMFTTVFVGNSQTRVVAGKMVTPRGYLQREG